MGNIRANDKSWIGEKFHKLTVIGFEHRNKRWLWKCTCDCGGETVTYPNQVIRGKTTSCGCNRSKTFRQMHYKHGKADTRIYRIWKDMRRRCSNNPSRNQHYGDRGIRVCEKWQDFETFYKWAIENGYTDTMSIERRDSDGDYSPDNCEWIPVKEQPYNTRRTIQVEIKGVKKPVGQWADELGLKRPTVYSRISKGWTPKEALEIIKRPF